MRKQVIMSYILMLLLGVGIALAVTPLEKVQKDLERWLHIKPDTVDFTVWRDPTVDPNDNVTWQTIHHRVKTNHDWGWGCAFKDPNGHTMWIIFHEITGELVNLQTYADTLNRKK